MLFTPLLQCGCSEKLAEGSEELSGGVRGDQLSAPAPGPVVSRATVAAGAEAVCAVLRGSGVTVLLIVVATTDSARTTVAIREAGSRAIFNRLTSGVRAFMSLSSRW
jgi:hypothetical protein